MASGKVKMKIKFKVEVWASQVVLVVKTPPANAGDVRFECSIPVFLPGESHGQRSLVRYSP